MDDSEDNRKAMMRTSRGGTSSAWCCWYWCQRPRTLSATEILVAASFNTAVRRISRVNSEDSLENVSLRYNTFVVPHTPGSPCPSVRNSWQNSETSLRNRDDKNSAEMLALVKPLQRHQEQLKMHPRFNERDTLSMGNRENYDNRSSDDWETRSYCNYSEDGDRSEDTQSLVEHSMSMCSVDDEDLENSLNSMEGKIPEAALDECFGSVIVSTRRIGEKIVGILVIQLRGVPWVGANEGLSIELRALGAHKSQWLFLPNARGPEVPVQREVSLKLHRASSKSSSENTNNSSHQSIGDDSDSDGDTVLLTVWPGCANHPRYSSIGNALIQIRNNERSTNARVMGLYGHTKNHGDLGSLEISLTSSSISSSSTTRTRGLLFKVLRAQGLKKPSFRWIAKKATKTLPDRGRLDVWCSVTMWISGEKIKKEVTPKVTFPVTGDPTFKSSCTFFVPKQDQHKACVVVKVHCGRSLHEETIGKLVLGPLLYLGSYRHPPLLPLDTSYPRPVTLSHWGRSFNTHFPMTAWHTLRL